jgi:hypothetical protein
MIAQSNEGCWWYPTSGAKVSGATSCFGNCAMRIHANVSACWNVRLKRQDAGPSDEAQLSRLTFGGTHVGASSLCGRKQPLATTTNMCH